MNPVAKHSASALGLAVLLASTQAARAVDALELPGKIDSVTVYRGQALVTRVVDIPAPGGLREVIVTGLPARVIQGSLFAEAGNDIEVRSVRYRAEPVSQDARENVRKLEDQIRQTQDAQAANGRNQQLSAERKAYLDKLEQFTAPTANAELTKGVLNADTLKTLTQFLFDQRQSIATDDLKLAKESRDLNENIALLNRQLQELSTSQNNLNRQAVVFANFPAAGGQLRLKYLVDSASWSPSYVARAELAKADAKRPVTIQYNASIQQLSGEDWNDVQMTLSTATPSLVATAPKLDALTISLAAVSEEQAAGKPESYFAQKRSLIAQRDKIENFRNSSQQGQANAPAATAADADLNTVSDKLQVLDLQARDTGRAGPANVKDQQGVTVTYQLPARTSLPSRSDQQSIQIASMQMTGDFYKLAMPVLTTYVYDQATIANAGKSVLLAGPVASYLDGQYVGVGELPTVAIGENFTVGFGIDSSLRATRELLEKTDSTQGGNRLLNFNYRLSLENFGSAPATVRLTDRLPTSKDEDVKITLISTAKEPTTQPISPESSTASKQKKGLLSWSIDVPAQAMGEKAVTLDYQYKMEFDKQMSIAGIEK